MGTMRRKKSGDRERDRTLREEGKKGEGRVSRKQEHSGGLMPAESSIRKERGADGWFYLSFSLLSLFSSRSAGLRIKGTEK